MGLELKEEVEFGLNFKHFGNELELGKLIQSGNITEKSVGIDKDALDKHIFITGVTGSGKTTTCQNILASANLPFLVIEPAKTEYRILLKEYSDLLIFTLGKDNVAPFRLNPFEFFEHESITSRVDMIKASIEKQPLIWRQPFHKSLKVPFMNVINKRGGILLPTRTKNMRILSQKV